MFFNNRFCEKTGNVYLNSSKTDCVNTEAANKLNYVKKVVDIYLKKMKKQKIDLEFMLAHKNPPLFLLEAKTYVGTPSNKDTSMFQSEVEARYVEGQPLYWDEVIIDAPAGNIPTSRTVGEPKGGDNVRNAALEEVFHMLQTKALQFARPDIQDKLDAITIDALNTPETAGKASKIAVGSPSSLKYFSLSAEYKHGLSVSLVRIDGKSGASSSSSQNTPVSGTYYAQKPKLINWYDFGVWENNNYKKTGSTYDSPDGRGDDNNNLSKASVDDEYLADAIAAYFNDPKGNNYRVHSGYTKQLCYTEPSRLRTTKGAGILACTKKVDGSSSTASAGYELATNHSKIYNLIQELFGTESVFE